MFLITTQLSYESPVKSKREMRISYHNGQWPLVARRYTGLSKYIWMRPHSSFSATHMLSTCMSDRIPLSFHTLPVHDVEIFCPWQYLGSGNFAYGCRNRVYEQETEYLLTECHTAYIRWGLRSLFLSRGFSPPKIDRTLHKSHNFSRTKATRR